MKKLTTLSLLALALSASQALAAEQAFEADTNHTVIGFKAGTLLFDVPGHFEKYSVDIKGDPDAPGATTKIHVEIDAASINTANSKRDDHLRTPDFFDVQKFPKIIFDGKKATRAGNTVTVEGTLTMHGVTQPVTIPFELVTAKNGAGVQEWVFKGAVPLKNSAYGLGAESVAARISLKDDTQLDLVLAGFFEAPPAPAADKGKPADKGKTPPAKAKK